MNGVSKGTSGVVNLGTVLTEHQSLAGKQDKLAVTGSAMKGVYVSASGVVSAMAHSLNADVPANAVFTDTTYSPATTSANGLMSSVDKLTLDRIAALLQNAVLYRTASGNPATFSDGAAENVQKLVVTLAPTQAGSGDPSPSNIRAISGVSSVKITRTGKNLCSAPDGAIYSDANVTISRSGGVMTVEMSNNSENTVELSSGIRTKWGGQYPNVIAKGPGTYTVTLFLDALSSSVGNPPLHRYLMTSTNGGAPVKKFTDSYIAATGTGAKIRTFTLADGEALVGVDLYWGSFTGSFSVRCQLEAGSAATAYESYQGASVTVPLVDGNNAALTVYGGALDVTAGTLTVTWGHIASYNGETLPGRWMSDRDVYAAGTTPTTGAQVAYELAPANYQTYSLTAQSLAALYGYNSVSANAGTVALEYRSDTSSVLGGS